MNIFKENYQRFLEQGLAVIPFYPFSDIPSVKGIKMLHAEGINKNFYTNWEQHHPTYNLGCLAGERSGVVFVKVSNADEAHSAIVEATLPPTPWVLVEEAFTTYAYRHRPESKSFSVILNYQERLLLQLKGTGDTQLLPPSKPTSLLPNLTVEADFEDLPVLPAQFEEIVRGSLLEAKVKLKPVGHSLSENFIPDGVVAFRLRVLADSLVRDTLSGLRCMQECLDTLETVAETLSENTDFSDQAHKDYYKFLAQDLEVLGKCLPQTWSEGLYNPKSVPFGAKDTEMSHKQIKKFVYDAITANFHDDEGRLEAIQDTLVHMNKAVSLDEVQSDILIRYITKQANLGITAATIRKRLKTLNTGSCPGENQTEVATVFLERLQRVAPFAFYLEKFWRFNGAFWEPVRVDALTTEIASVFGHLPAAKRSGDHAGILKICRGLLPSYIEDPKYTNVEGVNFANGYLTEELTLIPHHPDLGAQYVLPFPYDTNKDDPDKRPMFTQFLKDCWGDDDDYLEKLETLREAIAVTLFGMAYKYQKVFLLFGVPKSGKSQLLNIISSLVPTEAKTSLPPTEWSERFKSAQLRGKILNVAGELSESKLIDGHIFKDIVDGTEQLGENKGTDFFRFIPKCAHWFASNHFPKTKDTSEGFSRRWHVLTFKKPVPEGATIIRDLGNIIANQERESIVAWALRSLPSLTQRGEYTTPESHMDAIGDVANQNNSVRFFMTGSGLVLVNDRSLKAALPSMAVEQLKSLPFITGDVLHIAYSNFLLGEGGVRPVSSMRFQQMMMELCAQLGIRQQRVRYRNGRTQYLYYNLKLNSLPTGELTSSENPENPTPLSMDKMIGINQTD